MTVLTMPGAVAEPEERAVEEVHCVECNVPIPAIPAWYAQVNVRFTCDNCRQKSSKTLAVPTLDVETPRALDPDADDQPALDELDEDIEIDDADADADAETTDE